MHIKKHIQVLHKTASNKLHHKMTMARVVVEYINQGSIGSPFAARLH